VKDGGTGVCSNWGNRPISTNFESRGRQGLVALLGGRETRKIGAELDSKPVSLGCRVLSLMIAA